MNAVSVIIAADGRDELTAQCVEALNSFLPRGQFEIICEKYSDNDASHAKNIADAYNRGAGRSSGLFLLFLLNDVVATRRAFPVLYRALRDDPTTGAVGAVSNRAAFFPQRTVMEDYSDFNELDKIAEKISKKLSLVKNILVDSFFLLVNREAFKKSGGFDDGFETEESLSADFSLRLRTAGYGSAVAPVYVHRETPTEKNSDIIAKDRALFASLWGMSSDMPEFFWSRALSEPDFEKDRQFLKDRVVDYAEKLPLVSIMIPTYNRPKLFRLTLESALAQTYPRIEIIICDNSTNEETAALMESCTSDSRVRYFRNRDAKKKEENFVPFETMARGEYLQWLMDDDLLAPGKISAMMGMFLSQRGITLVTSRRGVIDGDGNFLGQMADGLRLDEEYGIYPGCEAGRAMLLDANNYLGEPSAVLFRRRDLDHHYWRAECRGYLVISDVAMWLELLRKGDCVIFRDPMSYYRHHDAQEGLQPDTVLLGCVEWERLITENFNEKFFIKNEAEYKGALKLIRDDWEERFGQYRDGASEKMRNRYRECIERINIILKEK